MYIIKNAFSNIRRNKRRNILLGIIITILIIGITVSIVINSTTKEVIEDYKERFGSDVTIGFDMDYLKEQMNKGQGGKESKITTKQYLDFADSEYIKSYSFTGMLSISFNEKLKCIGKAEEGGNSFPLGGNSGNNNDTDRKIPNGTVQFASHPSALANFKDGKRRIKEGNFFEKENEGLVSEDFAKLNNLSVGDKIEICDCFLNKTTEIIVCGIYEDYTDEYGDMPIHEPSMNRRNEVLMSLDSDLAKSVMDYIMISSYYELKNPEFLQPFAEELKQKGLGPEYKVTTDEFSYNKIVAPVLGMQKITNSMLWIVLVVGAIILIIVQSLTIRERKYEIGVLRAIGMKKGKLARMFIYENLIITVICLAIGFSVGSVVVQPVSNNLIESQIQIAEKNGNNDFGNDIIFEEPQQNQTEPLSTVKVVLSIESIVNILVISLAIAFISSIIGVVTVTRYEPLKILTERN